MVALAAACAGDDGEQRRVLPVSEASRLEEGEKATIEGHLFFVEVPARPPRLCASLSRHFPPRCRGGSVELAGISGELPRMEGMADGTRLWSLQRVRARGTIRNGHLAVKSLRDAPAR